MLNAEELIQLSNRPSTLPEYGGHKLFGLDDSIKEQIKLEDAVEQYNQVLNQQRITYKSCISEGHWDKEYNRTIIDVRRGPIWHKLAHSSPSGTFLGPEQTLFLMDQGNLELKYDGLPLSLHEAYMLIVPLLPSYEYYEVFSYLCRCGYIVRRFEKNGEKNVDDTGDSKWGQGLGSPDATQNHDEHVETVTDAEPMSSMYVKNLWADFPNEQPCMRPSEATSTAAVLSKLQVMELLKLKDIKYPSEVSSELQHKIDFDVYLSLRMKNKDSKPRFRVSVFNYSECMPSLCELACLKNDCDGVSLKLAVVNDGTVSFYSAFDTDLPTLISVG